MKTDSVWLYGAGGHALVVADALRDLKVPVAGLIDDNPVRVRDSTGSILPGFGINSQFRIPDSALIITIGNCRVRALLADRLDARYHTLIHPSAIVSRTVEIAEGSVVMHGAIVQVASRIGRHVIVNTGARVDHECTIHDFAHIAPSVNLCGDVTVGEGAIIGAGAIVLPGVRIGKWSVVGAGAVVLRDVPDYAVVVGNPARIIRYEQAPLSGDEAVCDGAANETAGSVTLCNEGLSQEVSGNGVSGNGNLHRMHPPSSQRTKTSRTSPAAVAANDLLDSV